MPKRDGYGQDAGRSRSAGDGAPDTGEALATGAAQCQACAEIAVTLGILVRRMDQVIDWLETVAYQQTNRTLERNDYVRNTQRVMTGEQ